MPEGAVNFEPKCFAVSLASPCINDNTTRKRRKTMSPAQLAANRANAKKSTGPRTAQGKARSARNALKHGLLARHLVLHDGDPLEVPQEFRILLHGLIDAYRPQTPAEQAIVQTIATCYWRLRRAVRFERQAILNARQRVVAGAAGRPIPFDPCSVVIPDAPDLDRLLLYETTIQRDLARATRQLDRLHRTTLTRRIKAAPAFPVGRRRRCRTSIE
jgi:hypothetical protein